MRKAAAPPPPPSRPLSVCSFADDSDSMSVESLDGRVKLKIVLPNGTVVPLEVERRTAMMDLLVLVTKANNLNPASHVLDVKNDNRDSVRYKPNTPIGSLDAITVHIVPKSSHDSETRIVTKSFEKTFRLRVHLPRNQLHVMRVSPQMPLTDIFNAICSERGLSSTRYEVRHPIHTEMNLNLACCLADYNLTEVALVATKEYNNSSSSNHSDTESVVTRPEEGRKKHGILNFMFKKSRSSTVEIIGDDRHKSATLPTNTGPPHPTISPASSMPSISNINVATNKASKKRQAPPPPPLRSKSSLSLQQKMPVAEDADEEGMTYTSHSRHSSDSSGYHEASILSDSPETNGMDVEHSVYKEKVAQKTHIGHTDSTSTLSMSTAGIKKRKAPPPPRLKMFQCSQNSKSTSPLSPQLEMTPDTTSNGQHHEENGRKEECHNDRLSNELSSDSEERQSEHLPVPKPRHIKVTNTEQSREDTIDNFSDYDCTTVVKECNGNIAHDEEFLNSCEKLSHSENTIQKSNSQLLDSEIILKQTPNTVLDETDITSNNLDCKSEISESHAQSGETPQLQNGSEHSVNSRNSSMNSETLETDGDVFSTKDKAETITRHSVSITYIKNTVKETGSVASETLNQVAFELGRKNSELSNEDQQTELNEESSVATQEVTINTDDKQDAEDGHLLNISNETNDQLPNILNETNDQIPHSRHSSLSSTKSGSDEVELAVAINEFHNSSNTTKEQLTSLWSHMITLPPNNRETDDDDKITFDNDDTLSLNEEHFHNDHDPNATSTSRVLQSELLEEPNNTEACNVKVNGMFDEDVSAEYRKTNEDVSDDIESDANCAPASEVDMTTDSDFIPDPIVTWEYKIPDVPHEFRDDTSKNLKLGEASMTLARYDETQDVTVISSSSPTTDIRQKYDNSEDKVQLRPATGIRRPTVMFSISTYKNRIEEETSYQDKLVKTESFSLAPNMEFSKVSSKSATTTSTSIIQEPIVKKSVPGQASSITNAITSIETTSDTEDTNGDSKIHSPMKKAKSEMQLNVQMESVTESVPITEHERLQEEYMKLHQQFIQWQKQLLNNQTVLQNQQILPDSTTDTLQPLQEFQQQFTSLPPTKTLQKQITLPRDIKTKSLPHSQSIESVHPSETNQSITERDIIYGPRPWRPVSISSWNQPPKFTAQKKEMDNSSEGVTKQSLDRKNHNDELTRQPYKERIASFNIGTFQKPTIKINRQTSHAAAFPRHPVVKGFANVPPQYMSHASPDLAKTSFPNGNNDRQSSNASDIPSWKSTSLATHKQTNRQKGKSMTYFGDFDTVNDNRHEDTNNKQEVKKQNNSVVATRTDSNKFTTVINVGRANSMQQQQAGLKPAMPQQKRSHTLERSSTKGETRDDLMTAIRDFGGRHGLKKVSSLETSWQERHGDVN